MAAARDFSSLFRLQSPGQPTSFFSSSWLKPNIQTESILVGDRPVKDKAGDQELASDINLTESTCHDVLLSLSVSVAENFCRLLLINIRCSKQTLTVGGGSSVWPKLPLEWFC